MPAWAKELRIFGLADWLADLWGRQWLMVMHDMWRGRRIDQCRITALLVAVLILNRIVLWAKLSMVLSPEHSQSAPL